MSRGVSRAPLAVTSDGHVLLNLARVDVPKNIEAIVRQALQQRGAVFIGVVLSPAEVTRLLNEAAMILPNVTGPVIGRRQRGRLSRR